MGRTEGVYVLTKTLTQAFIYYGFQISLHLKPEDDSLLKRGDVSDAQAVEKVISQQIQVLYDSHVMLRPFIANETIPWLKSTFTEEKIKEVHSQFVAGDAQFMKDDGGKDWFIIAPGEYKYFTNVLVKPGFKVSQHIFCEASKVSNSLFHSFFKHSFYS